MTNNKKLKQSKEYIIDPEQPTPRHTFVKLLVFKEKEKIL